MEEYKLFEAPHDIGEGTHKVYRFPNGYGASVIRFTMNLPMVGRLGGSYGSEDGLWEMALIKFKGDKYELVYEHGFDDVFGHLTDEGVEAKLEMIKAIEVSHGNI